MFTERCNEILRTRPQEKPQKERNHSGILKQTLNPYALKAKSVTNLLFILIQYNDEFLNIILIL